MSALRCIAGGDGGRELLALYLLGSLPADKECEAEAHMLRCAACRASVEALSEAAVTLAALTESGSAGLESGGPETDVAVTGTDPRQTPPAGRGLAASAGAGVQAWRRDRLRRALRYTVVLLAGAALGASGIALARGDRPLRRPRTADPPRCPTCASR
ncbi:hypothetical protein C1I95_20820 [Micromonospora craterilacus]|uniref:Zinc-finger domain-containing protein n=1 Tax=Micromonospora craterilacus TaxID=1655439 RepID=A0A2W2ER54_9ACTN|nr:hypothetical protein [Micromonospora craterilacus]PZG14878.1 hypothetical protein C1I95_20820 [Micromonospora craterilacus]